MTAVSGVDIGGSGPQEIGRGIAGFGTASLRGRILRSVALISGAVSLSILLSGCALLGGGSKPLDTYAADRTGRRRRQGTKQPADPDRRAVRAQGARRPEHRDLAGAGQHPVPQGRAMGRPAAEGRAGAAGRDVPALGRIQGRRQAGRGAWRSTIRSSSRSAPSRCGSTAAQGPRSSCSCACSTTATASVRAEKTFTATAPGRRRGQRRLCRCARRRLRAGGRRDRRLDGQDHLSRAPRMARDHMRKAVFKRLGLRPSTSSGLRTSTSHQQAHGRRLLRSADSGQRKRVVAERSQIGDQIDALGLVGNAGRFHGHTGRGECGAV